MLWGTVLELLDLSVLCKKEFFFFCSKIRFRAGCLSGPMLPPPPRTAAFPTFPFELFLDYLRCTVFFLFRGQVNEHVKKAVVEYRLRGEPCRVLAPDGTPTIFCFVCRVEKYSRWADLLSRLS